MPLCIKCRVQHCGDHKCACTLNHLRIQGRCRAGTFYQIQPEAGGNRTQPNGMWRDLGLKINLTQPLERYIAKPRRSRGEIQGYQIWHMMDAAGLQWPTDPTTEGGLLLVDHQKFHDSDIAHMPDDWKQTVKAVVDDIPGLYFRSFTHLNANNWFERVGDFKADETGNFPLQKWTRWLATNPDKPQVALDNYILVKQRSWREEYHFQLVQMDNRLVHHRVFAPLRQKLLERIQSFVMTVV